MSVSSRVQHDPRLDEAVEQFSVNTGRGNGQEYAVVPVKGGFKLYEVDSGYSQTSGQTLKIGKVVRRYDPAVWGTEKEGRAAVFTSPAEAEAYGRRWLASPIKGGGK